MSKELLNADKALIFRIVHRDNLADVLDHGCRSRSLIAGQKYTEIGNQELIQRRTARALPVAPGGTLSDYVPFYFTPYSPMLFNIKTGYNGIPKRPMSEIAILVSSLPHLQGKGIRFVFSDRHAYLKTALFYSDLADLDKIGWAALQQRNFKKDDVDRFEKYQAEALVYQSVPLEALLGIICYDESAKAIVQAEIDARGAPIKSFVRKEWYL